MKYGPGRPIWDLAVKMLKAGKTDEEILRAIRRKIPQAQTRPESIRVYRSRARHLDKRVPTRREAAANH